MKFDSFTHPFKGKNRKENIFNKVDFKITQKIEIKVKNNKM